MDFVLLRDVGYGVVSAHPDLRLKLAGAIGEDPGVQAAMAEYCVAALS